MKTSMCWLSVARWPALLLLFLFCCSDPAEELKNVTPPEEEEENEIIPGDVDALLETLSFSSGTKITGIVPSVANTSLVKSDSEDTIYTMPGVTMLLRLSHPQSTPVKGWYIAAKGSTFYFDVPIDDEEASDSVSVVILEIDAKDDEAPYDVLVEITPYDNNNQPIDMIERIITVEKPSANGCDILSAGDTSNNNFQFEWIWQWTVVLNSKDSATFINAPGRKFISFQHPTGCCDNGTQGGACPALVFNDESQHWEWVYNAQVTAITSYSIENEFFSFLNNGTFARFTDERILNFDPISTDWCKKLPRYSFNESDVFYFGTHNYVQGNSSISYATLRKECDDPWGLCGFASRPGSIKSSCNTLFITVDRLMLENTKETRMYRRRDGNPEDYLRWTD